MRIRFSIDQIGHYSELYVSELRERDRKLTATITNEVFPSYDLKGYLTKGEFLTVCEWKTPRSKPRCRLNAPTLIREISTLAKQTKSEQLRIQVWTLLQGVKWPTASVFLHFGFSNQYPIMDFRALWSLSTDVPAQYTYAFWQRYTTFCRSLACQAGVTMRVLDQALWKYSDLRQKQHG